MEIIKANNIGIKFKLNRFKRSNIKKALRIFITDGIRNKNSEFWALKNVSFTVNKGDILGVLGTNGSGKSTLLRTIGGIYETDEGDLSVNGSVSSVLSLVAGFKQELSGYENIFLTGVIIGFSKKEIEEQLTNIIAFAELEKFIQEPVKSYSSGMVSRLGFSIAVHLKRDIMLIDEILGVGDFRFKQKSEVKMKEIIKTGQTIVIVSHEHDEIKKYATKAIWIEKGKLMATGDVNTVMDKYENGYSKTD